MTPPEIARPPKCADILLQPRQLEWYRQLEDGKSSNMGYGGPRGGGKSGLARRAMLIRRARHRGTWGAIIRRVYDDLKINHIDEMFREYPDLREHYNASERELILPDSGGSKIKFMAAETINDVRRKAMGPQFMDVFVDQAEQFTEEEIREFKQMARWPGLPRGAAKLGLFFNMGGVGIQYFRRIFHTLEYQGQERPEDYFFSHVYGWDNVEWVRPALEEDGISEYTYYFEWTDQDRLLYFTTRSDYGINLASQDEVLRNRDLLGSWETLEGAYFGTVFDRNRTVLSSWQCQRLIQPWWNRWLSLDWGRAHFAAAQWHASGIVGPTEAKEILGWIVEHPITVAITYREHVTHEKSDRELANEILDRTPAGERRSLSRFFVGHDVFDKRGSSRTIADSMNEVLKGKLPELERANIERVTGWSLMYEMLLSSKRLGSDASPAWLIGPDCPKLIEAIPLLMRDRDNLEDVLKVDSDRVPTDDVADCARYGLRSYMDPKTRAPKDIRAREEAAKHENPSVRHIAMLRFQADEGRRSVISRAPRWRG